MENSGASADYYIEYEYIHREGMIQIQSQRSKMLRKNILLSSFMKVIGLVTSLLIVPITLGYLDNEIYGIWLTISSILYWLAFFDIGLGNGMRNYLAEAIAKGDFKTGRKYISTTFIILTVIATTLGIFTILPLTLLDFGEVFNTKALSATYLRDVLTIAIFFTLATFVARTIGLIYIALQQYAVNELISVGSHILSLIIIFILTKSTEGNLLYVVLALTATPVFTYLAATVPLFHKHPQLKPSLRLYEKNAIRQIVSKGMGFFLIQITSCLVIFGGTNIIITQFCGPEAVTTYNIAFKYFNLLTVGFTIILAPLWSAYTEAYAKGDITWIQNTFKRTLLFWGLLCLAGLCMLMVCNFFYELWVGKSVTIPFTVSLTVLLYIIFFNFNNCVTYLLNGLSTISVQIITSISSTALYLLVVYLMKGSWGIEGVVSSMAICYACMSFIHLYQCILLIRNRATGIWNK